MEATVKDALALLGMQTLKLEQAGNRIAELAKGRQEMAAEIQRLKSLLEAPDFQPVESD